MKIKFLLLMLVGLISNIMIGQKGELIGHLIDNENYDVLPFANVIVKNTQKGTTTDFEGKYELAFEEGVYTMSFSFIGYETKEISEVQIKAGQVTELNINLNPLSNELEEIVIKATVITNSEASMLNVQKRSINLMDGISSQTIKRIGASDLAEAVKSVPGVSVVAGKYVYIRGLGDRYTKSTLNGIDIPGLDPNRNTVQLDLFPTNIIENTQIVKSSTANLPADFTGGFVNIITKDFPNKKEFSFSISGSYNPEMHYNANYLTYKGGKTDFLGFDNGHRQLPINSQQYIPKPSDGNALLTEITNQFNPEMKAKKETNLMDYSIGFTAGNQFDIKGEHKIGFIASAYYKNRYLFYGDYQTGIYRRSADKSISQLELAKSQIGDLGRNNRLITGLAGVTFKTMKSKYKLTGMHIQNGISTAGFLEQQILFSDAVTIFKDNIEYKQSQISNILLSGKHSNNDGDWLIEWKLSPTYSSIRDKDIRVTPFKYEEDTDIYSISPSSAGNPARIWRNLEEVNAVGIIDVIKKHELFNKSAKVLFGTNYIYKQREFDINNYRIRLQGHAGHEFMGNANEVLAEDNIWIINKGNGSYIEGNYEPTNNFDANQSIMSAYLSEEFRIGQKLKSILGVRFEKFDLFYSGQNNFGDVIYDNEKVIDKADIFPSANFIYELTQASNLRLSYAKTTARPSFKEASITQIFDPLSSTTFIGNINLKPTYIDNIDFRFENYGENSQMYAASFFYKNFTDPIELTYFLAATDQFTPQNLGSANVFGVEFEIRKNFGFISDQLENLSLTFNTSIIKSELEIGKDELEARRLSLRDGEELKTTRQLQGQSPYLINFGLNYVKRSLQAGFFYNSQGKTLRIVGTGAIPDVYTMPFHSLDFNLNQSFCKEGKSNINIKVENILNDDLESNYQSFQADDQVFSKLSPGVSFTLGYSFKF